MKRKNIILFVALAIFSLTSCEMKEEILGGVVYDEVGELELDVTIKKPKTKVPSNPETENFPVTIIGVSEGITNVSKEYPTVAEVPASITLPVGTYKVSSHTPGEIQKQMPAPYYGGSDDIVVDKEIVATAEVVCKAMNSRIHINYGEDFLLAFSSWTITVDDDSDLVLTYTEKDKTPEDIYWYFEPNKVSSVTVNIRATTIDGNTVTDRRVFRKSDASENYEDVSEFFGGGDGIEINMGVVESSDGSVEGITVKTIISFEEYSETVEIPVFDDTDSGDEGDDNENPVAGEPVIELPDDFSYSVSTGEGKPVSADAWLKSEAGMKSAIVRIETSSDGFEATLKGVNMGGNLLEGIELVNNSYIDELFIGVSLEDRSPKPDVKEYKFPIAAFFTFLDMFTGEHKFYIKYTDNNDNVVEDVLTITITE